MLKVARTSGNGIGARQTPMIKLLPDDKPLFTVMVPEAKSESETKPEEIHDMDVDVV
jgi:hypothetical protein